MDEKILDISNKLNDSLNSKLILWDIGGGSTLGLISLGILAFLFSFGYLYDVLIGEGEMNFKSFKSKNKKYLEKKVKKDNNIVNLSNNKSIENNDDVNSIYRIFILTNYKLRKIILKNIDNGPFITLLAILVLFFALFGAIVGVVNDMTIKYSIEEASEEVHQLTKKDKDYEIVSIIKNKEKESSYIISYIENGIMKDMSYDGDVKIKENVENSFIKVSTYPNIGEILKSFNFDKKENNFLSNYDEYIMEKEEEITELVIKDTSEIK